MYSLKILEYNKNTSGLTMFTIAVTILGVLRILMASIQCG